MSCHSATFALQRGCFVPRECLAAKGLFCMVAHNCHSKTKNLTAKTKTSRQNQKPHGKNKIPHGKTKNLRAKPKYLTAKPNTSQRKQKSFGFDVGICFCRYLVVEIVLVCYTAVFSVVTQRSFPESLFSRFLSEGVRTSVHRLQVLTFI